MSLSDPSGFIPAWPDGSGIKAGCSSVLEMGVEIDWFVRPSRLVVVDSAMVDRYCSLSPTWYSGRTDSYKTYFSSTRQWLEALKGWPAYQMRDVP